MGRSKNEQKHIGSNCSHRIVLVVERRRHVEGRRRGLRGQQHLSKCYILSLKEEGELYRRVAPLSPHIAHEYGGV